MSRHILQFAFSFLVAVSIGSAVPVETAYPVPVRIEGALIPSTLYFVSMRDIYNTDLNGFASRRLDSSEKAVLDLIHEIQNERYAGIERLFVTEHPGKPTAAGAPQSPSLDPQATAKLLHDSFNAFRDVRILSRVYIGNRSLFIWEGSVGAHRVRRGFEVSDYSAVNIPKVELIDATYTVEVLAIEIAQAQLLDPGSYTAEPPGSKKTRIPLRVGGAESSSSYHPVFLECNVIFFNYALCDDLPSPSNDVLAFYKKTFMDMKKSDASLYCSAFGQTSAAKCASFVSNLTKRNQFAQYKADLPCRTVQFVLDGAPVYWVFYSAENQPTWTPGTLIYDYVFRSSKGQLLLANLFAQDFVDYVLQDHKVFDQSFFKNSSSSRSNRAR